MCVKEEKLNQAKKELLLLGGGGVSDVCTYVYILYMLYAIHPSNP